MTVEPIRDRIKIDELYGQLKQCNPKYAMIYKVGINTGLRISDIISLKVCDVYNEKMEFREYLILTEKKTKKFKRIKLNYALRDTLKDYIKDQNLNFNEYLFPSQKGGYVGRIQTYRVLKRSAVSLGIESFGTHSLRKTWGYWTYKISQHNIGLIMEIFNHSSQSVTLKYIGINQDQKDELYDMVQL